MWLSARELGYSVWSPQHDPHTRAPIRTYIHVHPHTCCPLTALDIDLRHAILTYLKKPLPAPPIWTNWPKPPASCDLLYHHLEDPFPITCVCLVLSFLSFSFYFCLYCTSFLDFFLSIKISNFWLTAKEKSDVSVFLRSSFSSSSFYCFFPLSSLLLPLLLYPCLTLPSDLIPFLADFLFFHQCIRISY